ncbi:MAG: peptidase, partial [Planctomycetota bacterium]
MRRRHQRSDTQQKRRSIVETLEARQLLAGPQLIGVQPNSGGVINLDGQFTEADGGLIANSQLTIRDTAPRVLTFRFDESQQIDPATLGGVQITRAGDDGVFGVNETSGINDDITIVPGLVSVGDTSANEVVVRFAESLPDDSYRINVFGFDDTEAGITGLRNTDGDLFESNSLTGRTEQIDFRLDLGALIESIVPQPVVRNADGTLTQNRNEVVVYFNEDPLFVEDDADGNPTDRSAENPDFYQLLLTQDSVRTTDDMLYFPEEVVYDSVTHTARLFFATDINELPGVPVGGGTFRLRVGTSVETATDLIVEPVVTLASPSATVQLDVLGADGQEATFEFVSQLVGDAASGQIVQIVDSGSGGVVARVETDNSITIDVGGITATVGSLRDAMAADSAVNALARVRAADSTLATPIPARLIDGQPITLVGLGDTLSESLDVGSFTAEDNLTSLVINESISAQPFDIQLPGGDDDVGHSRLISHINDAFGADNQYGITEIPYNFQGFFAQNGTESAFNQIENVHKERIREALDLWSVELGVQFRETASDGITFALGQSDLLLTSRNPFDDAAAGITTTNIFELDAAILVDPALNDNATAAAAESTVVFSNQAAFGLAYGEDFTRKAAASIGLLLGLQAASDLPDQSLLALAPAFLEDTIDTTESNDPLNRERVLSEIVFENIDDFLLPFYEPVFPSNIDIQHGQHIHRPDSTDIDLYQFQIDLDDADRVGRLSVETFAERLPDASELDTSITLYEEVRAYVETDLRVGPTLSVRIEAVDVGFAGNGGRIEFIESDRVAGDTEIRIFQASDSNLQPVANAIVIDVPRTGVVEVGDVVDAINADPLAASLFIASIPVGSPSTDIGGGNLFDNPLVLSGGGLEQLARNDDYFSNDSFITRELGAGVYYVGVSASGNDSYDPTIAGSGFGGTSQGDYELRIKFEPQVDEINVLRDLDIDAERPGVPGTAIDGDGDGVPGGVENFWFQTRPTERILRFDVSGDGLQPEPGEPNPTITILSGTNVERTYEFVPTGTSPRPGNIAVEYNPGTGNGFSAPPSILASSLATQINDVLDATGVEAFTNGGLLTLTGEREIELSANLDGITTFGRNLFVDKLAGPDADGTLLNPFNNIANPAVANAFGSSEFNDIIRVVGNGGADEDITTEFDNFSYQVGLTEVGGQTLEDGRNLEVPRGVTMMVDAGAIFKMRSSRISVGSSNIQDNRNDGALQVLGTPRLVSLSTGDDPTSATFAPVTSIIGEENVGRAGFDDGSVIFTSLSDRVADRAAAGIADPPERGDWGGLVFRRDIDDLEGRRNLEDEGIFLQTVNHAEILYGGSGDLLVGSVQQTVNPIQLIDLRPNISFNEIGDSADAAISAAPNSFEETTFGAPSFQQAGAFTADYGRVGPEIHNNQLIDNSINGLFIRSTITPTSPPVELTVSGRFDDVDIVHFIAENLVIAGNPGGSITDDFRPSLQLVSGQTRPGGTLAPADGRVEYRMTFVDADGFESAPTEAGDGFIIAVEDGDLVQLAGLPTVSITEGYVSRRIYRADVAADDSVGEFRFVADLDASSSTFTDTGSVSAGTLDLTREGRRGRLDGSLVVDPGVVVKLQGARIELGHGTQLLAEGTASQPVIFTSSLDDRFGAGGTFDTNNDNETDLGARSPQRGDWSGIYASPNANVSLDHATVAYGGGISLVEGGQSRGFAALELQQATGRITNSRFEFNEDGQGGSSATGRSGRLAIDPSTIFVRGSQPIIVGNEFVDNHGTLIEIDVDSLTVDNVIDLGRQTGDLDRFSALDDNQGPLVRLNRYQNVPGSSIPLSTDSVDQADDRQISGMRIRGGVLNTESVWDDTDIVHVLTDSIVVENLQSSGGLLLKSRPNESLVVKLGGSRGQFDTGAAEFGPGTPNSPTIGTGLTATGSNSDTTDRVGGSIQVIGLPGAPVVLTSWKDDTVGAGLAIDGTEFTDTNGDGFGSRPASNDWRSILLDQYSNDRNVAIALEQELPTEVLPGRNGSVFNAQVLGDLAADINSGDDVRRLGFEVIGNLSSPGDIDTYSFTGTPGSEVWIDVDRTTFGLDTVIEILDVNGNVLARSDDSLTEIEGTTSIEIIDPSVIGNVLPLQAAADQFTDFTNWELYDDAGSTNPRDAGLRYILPGNPNTQDGRNQYFFRIRSASLDANDASSGSTQGRYEFQLRLRESQEHPGSTVRYADIRYANHGVHVRGLPGESPLLGEAQENESVGVDNGFFLTSSAVNDVLDSTAIANDDTAPLDRPQLVGNLLDTKNGVISIAGTLEPSAVFGTINDIDFYQVDMSPVLESNVDPNQVFSTVFDIDYADGLSRPDTNLSVFYDPDGERGSQLPRLVLFSDNSNVADDLTSPNGEDDLIERLSAGSTRIGDPIIGPVSLPTGAYYVAVTDAGVVPDQLNSDLVRREPINSIQRLFEDRVEASPGSTASGPRNPFLFDEFAVVTGGFEQTTLRGGEFGHGTFQNFDGSGTNQNTQSETLYVEPGVTTISTGGAYTGFQSTLVDAGNLPLSALDLTALEWSLNDNPQIGSEEQLIGGPFVTDGVSLNTSTTIPHVSIQGNLSFDSADFYRIVVPEDNTRVIIDVDEGFNPFLGPEDDDDFPTLPTDLNSVNVDLVVIANPFAFATIPNRIETSDPDDGRFGSVAPDFVFDDDIEIGVSTDPFFDGILNAGEYFIGVVHENTAVTIGDNGVTVANDNLPTSGQYVVHISQENFPVEGQDGGNQSLYFNRNLEASGQLTSVPFDLTGYVAEDQPRFYFNYRFDAVPDSVALRVRSDQNLDGIIVRDSAAGNGFTGDGVWRQDIIDLGPFAGDTNITFEFEYTGSDVITPGVDGLFLDDFIVGFAERGETIFNADGGATTFSGGAISTTGEYQLEIRPGTTFGQGTVTGQQVLNTDFDTNDRQAREITLVAPAGSQLVDGDYFTLSDGVFTQEFEFSTDGSVDFGRQRIDYNTSDTAAQIAERIRLAVNQSSSLDMEAASASGLDTEAMTGRRINLFGAVSGSLQTITSILDAPSVTDTLMRVEGQLQLPAILIDGQGDQNRQRVQGQVIIENNNFRDIHAIAVYSESGDRGTDIEDLRQDPQLEFNANVFGGDTTVTTPHPFLQLPPVGNPAAGAARNLPVANDSVIGGLTPGVVIQNNTIDQAGLAGVKIEGETRPFVIETGQPLLTDDNEDDFEAFLSSSITVTDGFVLAIDAGGTRVIFEFEDVAGIATMDGGSGVVGGDGYVDGHVPVFYRHPGTGGYNDPPTSPRERDYGYNSFELLLALQQSIQGSILVTNDLAELVTPSLGPSMSNRNGFLEEFAFTPELFPTPALYLEGVSQIYQTSIYAKQPGFINVAQLAVAEAAQPLARVVNNTIYGADGTESAFPEAASTDGNDLLSNAT